MSPSIEKKETKEGTYCNIITLFMLNKRLKCQSARVRSDRAMKSWNAMRIYFSTILVEDPVIVGCAAHHSERKHHALPELFYVLHNLTPEISE